MRKEKTTQLYDRVYNVIKKCEPQTPNEIAEEINLNPKTIQSILLDLAYEKEDVKMKKIGRYRMFWKTD